MDFDRVKIHSATVSRVPFSRGLKGRALDLRRHAFFEEKKLGKKLPSFLCGGQGWRTAKVLGRLVQTMPLSALNMPNP